jgi:TetR/AcrR family transcriptional regulator, fatty acid metabolism regulator protein
VSAAIEEFALNGYHRTKISDIVRRADVSQPAFYLYFSGKLALYRHLVKRVRKELLHIIEHARVPPDLPPDMAARGVREAIKAFIEYFADNPKLAVIGYFEAEGSESLREEVTIFVARNVMAEQKSGYLRRDFDAMLFSECYNGGIDRLIRRYLLTGEMTVDQVADAVGDLYVRGMQRRDR